MTSLTIFFAIVAYLTIAKYTFLTLKLWDALEWIDELIETGTIDRANMKKFRENYKTDSKYLAMFFGLIWPVTITFVIVIGSLYSLWNALKFFFNR